MSSDAPPPLGEWLFGLVEPAVLMAWAMRRKCLLIPSPSFFGVVL